MDRSQIFNLHNEIKEDPESSQDDKLIIHNNNLIAKQSKCLLHVGNG